MELNLLFNIVLILLISVLLLFIIKSFIKTNVINKRGKNNLVVLDNKYRLELEKCKLNNQNILLLDDLYVSLFSRVFKITQDLILIQKIIFDKKS